MRLVPCQVQLPSSQRPKKKKKEQKGPDHCFCPQGLLPVYFNPTSARFTTNKVSLGAMGDSYYEYLLKVGPPACELLTWKMDEGASRTHLQGLRMGSALLVFLFQ